MTTATTARAEAIHAGDRLAVSPYRPSCTVIWSMPQRAAVGMLREEIATLTGNPLGGGLLTAAERLVRVLHGEAIAMLVRYDGGDGTSDEIRTYARREEVRLA